jgi:hypothetical protein
VSHFSSNLLPLNREGTIFCGGGESIAIDPKFNYLTKINYHVRARSGRPKNDGSIPRNLSSWLELSVSMISSDIHELKTRHHMWSVRTLA